VQGLVFFFPSRICFYTLLCRVCSVQLNGGVVACWDRRAACQLYVCSLSCQRVVGLPAVSWCVCGCLHVLCTSVERMFAVTWTTPPAVQFSVHL